jgi:hypothetical protein
MELFFKNQNPYYSFVNPTSALPSPQALPPYIPSLSLSSQPRHRRLHIHPLHTSPFFSFRPSLPLRQYSSIPHLPPLQLRQRGLQPLQPERKLLDLRPDAVLRCKAQHVGVRRAVGQQGIVDLIAVEEQWDGGGGECADVHGERDDGCGAGEDGGGEESEGGLVEWNGMAEEWLDGLCGWMRGGKWRWI